MLYFYNNLLKMAFYMIFSCKLMIIEEFNNVIFKIIIIEIIEKTTMKKNKFTIYIKVLISSLLALILLSSCGIYRPVDAKKISPKASDRVKANIEKGEGFRVKGILGKSKSGDFDFATSNELWRATLDILDFAPLSNVDYSGGIIITDWFSEKNNNNNSLKITVRFLSNEIRADGLEVILHKKTCNNNSMNCTVSNYSSKLNNQIKLEILKKATILEKMDKDKYLKEHGEYKIQNLETEPAQN